jgi:hypothetical protein
MSIAFDNEQRYEAEIFIFFTISSFIEPLQVLNGGEKKPSYSASTAVFFSPFG